MEINFKFKVGDFVRYCLHPEVRFLISERIYQECYSACAQIHYKVRQIVERDFGFHPGISRDLVMVTEPELELITPEEIEDLKKVRDKFKK